MSFRVRTIRPDGSVITSTYYNTPSSFDDFTKQYFAQVLNWPVPATSSVVVNDIATGSVVDVTRWPDVLASCSLGILVGLKPAQAQSDPSQAETQIDSDVKQEIKQVLANLAAEIK